MPATSVFLAHQAAAELVDWFKGLNSVLVAFSGGVDSAVVAKAAHLAMGARALAVTADSPSLARAELALAKELVDRIGIRHQVIQTQEVQDLRYRQNDSQRCYFCKSHLFSSMQQILRERFPDAHIVTGTNQEDLANLQVVLVHLKLEILLAQENHFFQGLIRLKLFPQIGS